MSTPVIPAVPMPSFAGAFAPPEELGDPRSIAIYGEPGTFKTSIAGGIIKVEGFNRGLYIDVDNGTEVFVNDPVIRAAVKDGRISILKIDKLDPMAFLKLDAALKELQTQNFGFDFVALDAVDVAQKIAVKHFLATTYNERGVLDSRAAWGEVGVWTDDVMWGFQNTPHFVGITVFHSTVDEEKTGATRIKPKLQGAAKDSIGGIPSIVAFVKFEKNQETDKVELVGYLGKSDEFVSKSRYSRTVPDRFPNFNLVSLYERIRSDEDINAPAAPAAIINPAAPAATDAAVAA